MMEQNSPLYSSCSALIWSCVIAVICLSPVAGFAQSSGVQPLEKSAVRGGEGRIKFDITDIVGRPLAARGVVEFSGSAGRVVVEMRDVRVDVIFQISP